LFAQRECPAQNATLSTRTSSQGETTIEEFHLRVGAGLWVLRFVILASFLTLFFLAQRFWYRRALSVVQRAASPRWRRVGRWALTLVAALIVLTLADRLFFHVLSRRGVFSWLLQITQLWLFASSLAFLAIEAVHCFEWTWSKVNQRTSSAPVDVERRAFFKYAGYAAGSVPLIAGIYGFAEERFDFRVRRTEVPVANLPAALDGFRIVQLSDIHIGDFMPAGQVRRAVDMANELGAHLALSTGDLLTGKGDPLQRCVAELSRLRAPLGVWGCNGNHEIYADAEDEAEELFRRYGMTMLRQRNVQLRWNGAPFNLIGVDYQRERLSPYGPRIQMLEDVEALVRRDMPNVLLSHNPNSFYRAAELGIELSLAGHTHGGQIKVEIVDHSFSPARFITDFVAGLYQLPMAVLNGKHAQLYVNRGIGTIGVPARIGVDPEITLLTLRRAV
jgi:predicted MPP superfamily phosphohydrolase